MNTLFHKKRMRPLKKWLTVKMKVVKKHTNKQESWLSNGHECNLPKKKECCFQYQTAYRTAF